MSPHPPSSSSPPASSLRLMGARDKKTPSQTPQTLVITTHFAEPDTILETDNKMASTSTPRLITIWNRTDHDDGVGVSTMTMVSDAKDSGVDVIWSLMTAGFMILMLLICVGNLLVLLAIWKTPALQTHTNYLIAHLAFIDFLLGFQINQRLLQDFWPHLLEFYAVCCLRQFARIFVSQGGGLFLIAIGLERCVGIFKPLHYNMWITKCRLHTCAAAIWLYSLILSLPCIVGLLKWQPGELCEFYLVAPPAYICWVAIYFLLCVGIILVLYIGIIKAAKDQQSHIEQYQGGHSGGAEQQLPDARLQRLKSNLKAMRTYMMIVSIFAFTWIWAAFLLLSTFLQSVGFLQTVHKIGQLLMSINSVANPIIYALRMKSFRGPMKRLLLCGRGTNQIHPVDFPPLP